MDDIKRILCDDIERLNHEEKRDNKVRYSPHFIRQYPYLFWGMVVSYIPVAIILWSAHYFGVGYVVGFTLFVAAVALALSFNINPRYRFEDIDKLDLRECYNGEWYSKRRVSPDALQRILNSNEVSDAIKNEIKHIQQAKGRVTFFDVFSAAYLKAPSELV